MHDTDTGDALWLPEDHNIDGCEISLSVARALSAMYHSDAFKVHAGIVAATRSSVATKTMNTPGQPETVIREAIGAHIQITAIESIPDRINQWLAEHAAMVESERKSEKRA